MKKAFWIGAGVLFMSAAVFALLHGSDLLAQDGPWGGGRGGGRGGPMGRMGSRPGSMTAVGKHLFVASGPLIYKIDTNTMDVVDTLELKPPDRGGEDREEDEERRGR
ncbi:MAG: hypothetical protein ACYTFG_11155 [Planctomycetota bacterium]|jgi:hypothetical protein